MGVRKNPFTGEITEEETRMVRPAKRASEAVGAAAPGRDTDAATEPVGESARPARDRAPDSSHFDAPTRRVDPLEAPADTERTRLLRPRSGAVGAHTEATGDPMTDPVIGWLVVVAGPGKGRVCRLGYGANTLGCADSARVRLDFGDDRISREAHATLTYDPRGRTYYLQHGGGMNLTYLGDQPVLAPTVLEPMQEIAIGDTTLRFVPLCGPGFDWQDLEEE